MENRSAHISISCFTVWSLFFFLLKRISKFLISYESQLIYEKLPQDISERHVLLLDPVLATGTLSLFRWIFYFWWIFFFYSEPYLHDCWFFVKVTLLIKPLNYSFRKEFLNLTSSSSTLSRWVLKLKLFASLSLSTNYYYNIVLWQAPEGIHCVCKRFPALKIVTSEIDQCLNQEFRVIPGLGEFGDRYFGTDE